MNADWSTDTHFEDLRDALTRMLEHDNGKPFPLLAESAKPYPHPEDHPIIVLARRAVAEHATEQAKTTIIRRLLDETGNRKTYPVILCVDLFDAIVENDVIKQRQALKELARGLKRPEWNEAV